VSNSTHTWKKVLIPTGIAELDELLVRELNPNDFVVEASGATREQWSEKKKIRGEQIQGGFVYLSSDSHVHAPKWKTPVILIEGPSASGKTLLSLQLSLGIVERTSRKCIFYSLERDPEILSNTISSFKAFGFSGVKWNLAAYGSSPVARGHGVYFQRLSPRPLQSTRDPSDFFEERFRQLENAIIDSTNAQPDPSRHKVFFFVDSLSVLGREPLSRDSLLRLFNLFRSYNVPVVFTVERQTEVGSADDRTQFQTAKYLADVVIRLHAEEGDYFSQFIEITNTSFSSHVLGRHLLKIWTPPVEAVRAPTQGNLLEKFQVLYNGLTIFPSLHYLITRARQEKEGPDQESIMFHIPPVMDVFPVGEIIEVTGFPGRGAGKEEMIAQKAKRNIAHAVPRDSLVVLSGPMGCRKFALATNLFLASLVRPLFKQRPRRKTYEPARRNKLPVGLILSFSVEQEIKLGEIPQYTMNPITEVCTRRYARLDITPQGTVTKIGTKAYLSQYTVKKRVAQRHQREIAKIILANFRLGTIAPEEVVYFVDKWLRHVDSILFVDTALVRSGFPFLHKSPIFYASLIDILKERRLFSVFIDVCGTAEKLTGPHEALLAEADFRIFLKPISMRHPQKKARRIVEFHVENIRSKGYDIQPRYLGVRGKELLIREKWKDVITPPKPAKNQGESPS